MEIPAAIAQEIVAELKGALQHEVNFFNTHGICIASTDHSRIGGTHEAAQLAITQQRTIAVDNNHQYAGARPGINAPVMIGNQVVAAVGITGNCDEVAQYGEIIRKMTEILVRENLDQHMRFDRRLMQANLIDMLTRDKLDMVSISYLASSLSFALDRERTVVVGRFDRGVAPQYLREHLATTIASALEHSPQSIWSAGAGRGILLVDNQEVEDIEQLLQHILDEVNSQGSTVVLRFGIGSVCNSLQDYTYAHTLATRAVHWISFTAERTLASLPSTDIGMLVTALPRTDALQIIDHVLGNIDAESIDEYSNIMHAYSLYNGAITKAAESLYIHKNTLQNKLNTIAQITGYNPRNHKDYVLLSLAFTLRDWLAYTQQAVHDHSLS